MNRLRFAFLITSTFAATAFACGGISDPTRSSGESVATVSGALTGTAVPANARVALVWRKVTSTGPGSASTAVVEVGTDVPVVDGKFTMNLGVPGAEYFSSVEGNATTVNDSVSAPPSTSPSAPKPAPSAGTSGGAAGSAPRITPRDLVGGSITEPMTAALGGFVVYIDTNGNGKLDLEGQYASSPDQIIGGNKELILTYLKGGGALDYEKLRDKSGILPTAGFDLAWTEGRWIPLSEVELKLSATAKLPSNVCSSYGYSSGGSSGSGVIAKNDPSPPPNSGGGSSGTSSSGSVGTGGYPSSSDPNLSCSPDGRSYSYNTGSTCPPPQPAPVGLCAGDWGYAESPCASARYTNSLTPGQPVPAGWPCDVAPDVDGGPAPDSGSSSGSSGAIDGGGI